eukprot:TRINITY_DN112224_c0_g1_i1.p1 TRINITY_DN112224_c0_g1~~TRINITY_DN112224_c0_g1_i1.p1  ORF type:complete len:326 (-),score=48.60 TRINITY_DN112224_c0_g1_i1:22-999(-)
MLKLANPPLDCISRVRFAPINGSSQLLASSWDARVRLYDAATGQFQGIQIHPLAVLDCAFTQDPLRCLSVGLSRQVVLYDFRAQQEQILGYHDEAIRCVEFHHQSQQVFTSSWDRTLKAWDPRQGSGTPIADIELGTKAFSMDVGADKIIIGGADRCVHMYDIRMLDREDRHRECSLKNQIRCVRIGLDQRRYGISSVEGRVAIEYFDSEENSQSRYMFKCHRVEDKVNAVNALAFHPVHGTFATGGSDGGICVWDSHAKKRLCKLSPFETSVSCMEFSADGTQLAIGVSYTFDDGERMPPPVPELIVRRITDSEVLPYAAKGKD